MWQHKYQIRDQESLRKKVIYMLFNGKIIRNKFLIFTSHLHISVSAGEWDNLLSLSTSLLAFTLNLIMVLKWLFLKKTQSSPSCTVEVSSHKPWYVSWVAVLFRNCSAMMPDTREKYGIKPPSDWEGANTRLHFKYINFCLRSIIWGD